MSLVNRALWLALAACSSHHAASPDAPGGDAALPDGGGT